MTDPHFGNQSHCYNYHVINVTIILQLGLLTIKLLIPSYFPACNSFPSLLGLVSNSQ